MAGIPLSSVGTGVVAAKRCAKAVRDTVPSATDVAVPSKRFRRDILKSLLFGMIRILPRRHAARGART